MSYLNKRNFFAGVTACLLSVSWAHASSISVSPAASSVDVADGTAVLTILADFTSQPTQGGYTEVSFGGDISLTTFPPSAWFTGCEGSPSGFCEFSTAAPGAGFTPDTVGGLALSLGDFFGISTAEIVGTVTVNLLGAGLGTISLADNSFGAYLDLGTGNPMTVDYTGADINITAVPVPAAVWMFGSALGLLGFMRRRMHKA